MDGYSGFSEIKALQELICPINNDSDSEDDLSQAGARKLSELFMVLNTIKCYFFLLINIIVNFQLLI